MCIQHLFLFFIYSLGDKARLGLILKYFIHHIKRFVTDLISFPSVLNVSLWQEMIMLQESDVDNK